MLQIEDIHLPNNIVLSSKQMRQTVFWILLQNSIVFDTEKDAIAYRQYTLRKGIRCPSLSSLDGKVIPSSGIMDSTHRQIQDVSLNYVFGSKPKNPQIKELEKG